MKVVVVGAGFAGLAAAVALIERRHEVTLLERRGVLGGRATSFPDAQSGTDVDNGTHLMVGAYTATLDLIRRAGAGRWLWEQDELRLDWIDAGGMTSLDCPPLPAPLHLFAGLMGLRLPWRVRLQALRLGWHVRFGADPVGLTLAEYLARAGQGPEARRLLWDPLATAMLNETPERAAAVLFRRVFHDAFLCSRRASRLVFLRCGWGRLHEQLADYFQRRGGQLRRRALVEAVELDGARVRGVRLTQRAENRAALRAGKPAQDAWLDSDAVVAAVPWGVLPALLPEPWRARTPFAELARFKAAPIVSVELWLDRPVLPALMLGFREGEMEWVFDKGRLFGRTGLPQHLSFVISAAHRAHPRPKAELVAAAEAALRRHFPAAAEARVQRSLVLREAAATFSADPATEGLRPGNDTPIAGLYLAGDWTNTGLPATIEGAVRSGRAAAAALERG
jgi:squalene-associated FAD-dependent desaturase